MAETAGAPQGAQPPALDEVMMAMDVVDTLRHNEGVALRELEQDGRDEVLKERLRAIYEGQGLAVSDEILDEGIRALKESRFVYTPTGSGFRRWLAGLWIRRSTVGKGLAAMLVALGAWTGWGIYQDVRTEQAAETARIELTRTLPQKLKTAGDAAAAEARTSDARDRVAELRADGQTALARSDAAAAQVAVSGLERLRVQLVQSYMLRIVSRPGEQSGIYRIPDVNGSARNYYVIVEAVTPDGKLLSLPVTSEEDGKTATVSKWGIRVPQQTYDAVRRDKQDDGILQNNVVGEKPRGALKPVYGMAVMNGAITQW